MIPGNDDAIRSIRLFAARSPRRAIEGARATSRTTAPRPPQSRAPRARARIATRPASGVRAVARVVRAADAAVQAPVASAALRAPRREGGPEVEIVRKPLLGGEEPAAEATDAEKPADA